MQGHRCRRTRISLGCIRATFAYLGVLIMFRWSLLACMLFFTRTVIAAGGDLEFAAALPFDLSAEGRIWNKGRYHFLVEDWNSCKIKATRIDVAKEESSKNAFTQYIKALCNIAPIRSNQGLLSVLSSGGRDRVVILFETPDYKINKERIVLLRFTNSKGSSSH